MEDSRNIYRKIILLMVAVLFITICAIYIFFIGNIGRVYEEHAVESIVNIKKDFLKNSVDNLILEIDLIQRQEETYYDQRIKTISQILQKYYDTVPEDYINLFIDFTKTGENKDALSVYIKAIESQELLYATGLFLEGNPKRENFSSYFKGKYDDYEIAFGISSDYIYTTTKKRISERLYSQEFSQGSYIWVTEIIDYNGGKDFAIRAIYPDSPDTEGDYISTETQDLEGNYLYAEALKEINEKGEVFLDYYFKKNKSDIISEKITYAKQYKNMTGLLLWAFI